MVVSHGVTTVQQSQSRQRASADRQTDRVQLWVTCHPDARCTKDPPPVRPVHPARPRGSFLRNALLSSATFSAQFADRVVMSSWPCWQPPSRAFRPARDYRVVPNKWGHRLVIIILSNLNRFKKKFAGRSLGKFVVKWILKITPHLAYVATLSHYLVKH